MIRHKGSVVAVVVLAALVSGGWLLQRETEPLERKLSPETAAGSEIEKIELDEKTFRWLLNENAMAWAE